MKSPTGSKSTSMAQHHYSRRCIEEKEKAVAVSSHRPLKENLSIDEREEEDLSKNTREQKLPKMFDDELARTSNKKEEKERGGTPPHDQKRGRTKRKQK